MSEQSQSQTLARETYDEDNDPLAELARIVAGEPEPESDPDPDPVPESEPAVDESLAADGSASDETFDRAEAALDHAAEGLQSLLLDELEPADVPQEGASVNGDHESEFQDELISILQNEIENPGSQNAAERVPETNEYRTSQEILEEDERPQTTSRMDDLEEELSAALGLSGSDFETTRDDPEAGLTSFDEPDVAGIEPDLREPFEPETAPFVDSDDPEQTTATEPSVSLEEDLGAAFADQFEQMLSTQTPQEAEVGFVEPETVPEADALFESHDETPFINAEEPEPRTVDVAEQELDFGSAFAEELGVDHVEGLDGWQDGDTVQAEDDFARAAVGNPEVAGGDQYYAIEDGDPGHLETIPGQPQAAEAPYLQQSEGGSSRKYAVAALVIALFAGSIAAGYGFLGGGTSGGDGAPVLVKADAAPFKVKPDDPGGRVPANQDAASYEKVEGELGNQVAQESLVSDTEEPADVGSANPLASNGFPDKSDDRLSPSTNDDQPSQTTPGDLTPRVVQTVTVRPDGTIVPAASGGLTSDTNTLQSDNAPLAQREELVASVDQAIASPTPVETSVIKVPGSIDGARASGEIAVPEASPIAKPTPQIAAVQPQPEPAPTVSPEPATPTVSQVQPAAAEPAASLPVAKSEWVVQVSSQRSAEAAQASFENLKNRFAVLDGRPMSIQRANVNGATFYRVRLQTESKADATQLCSQLKQSGGSCFVSR